jgi:hypothetical protein
MSNYLSLLLVSSFAVFVGMVGLVQFLPNVVYENITLTSSQNHFNNTNLPGDFESVYPSFEITITNKPNSLKTKIQTSFKSKLDLSKSEKYYINGNLQGNFKIINELNPIEKCTFDDCSITEIPEEVVTYIYFLNGEFDGERAIITTNNTNFNIKGSFYNHDSISTLIGNTRP